VEAILGTRRPRTKEGPRPRWYLVRFKGYGAEHDEWVPATRLHAPVALKEFLARGRAIPPAGDVKEREEEREEKREEEREEGDSREEREKEK